VCANGGRVSVSKNRRLRPLISQHFLAIITAYVQLYGEWYQLPALTPEVHKITVTLNANSHEDLTVTGTVVSDTKEEEPWSAGTGSRSS